MARAHVGTDVVDRISTWVRTHYVPQFLLTGIGIFGSVWVSAFALIVGATGGQVTEDELRGIFMVAVFIAPYLVWRHTAREAHQSQNDLATFRREVDERFSKIQWHLHVAGLGIAPEIHVASPGDVQLIHLTINLLNQSPEVLAYDVLSLTARFGTHVVEMAPNLPGGVIPPGAGDGFRTLILRDPVPKIELSDGTLTFELRYSHPNGGAKFCDTYSYFIQVMRFSDGSMAFNYHYSELPVSRRCED